MKNIKKIALGMALTCMIVLCPILCLACGGGKVDANGKKMATALDDSITIIKEHNAAVEEAGAVVGALPEVEYSPIEQEQAGASIVYLEYVKEILLSSKFEYTTSPFKAKAVVTQGDLSDTITSYNKVSIVDNLVTVEVYFASEGSQDIDYEWIQIDYDFENNNVNSFELYEYIAVNVEEEGLQETFYAYKYQDQILSKANEQDGNYAELKNEVKKMGTELGSTEEFAYERDFTKEFNKVLIV